MSVLTSNYNLIKPQATDPIDLLMTNPNWDIIDEKLQEAANSGGTSVVVQSEPPTDKSVLWIDTSDNTVDEGSSEGGNANSAALIAEHNVDETAHEDIRNLVTTVDTNANEAKSTADTASALANDAYTYATKANDTANSANERATEVSIQSVSYFEDQNMPEEQKAQARANIGIVGTGIDGEDGVSPIVSISDITGGKRLTITDAEGTKTADIMNGINGAPFTYEDFTSEQLESLKGSDANVTAENIKNALGYTPADEKDIPTVPVQSVNGKTGTVQLTASDVGARPNTWTPTAQEVGAEASGTISTHNTNTEAHNDIRLAIKEVSDELKAFLDVTDEELNQLSEVIELIQGNSSLIEGITTSKVNVADIVNNLTTNVTNKPLSAAQGVALKALIDKIAVPAKVSELENDMSFMPIVMQSGEPDDKDVLWIDIDDEVSGEGTTGGAVCYDKAQNLSEAQKAQARMNISALDRSHLPTIVQEAGESESLVMSQKAVTKLVEDALGTGGGSTQYETVDSIEEMIDTSKQYVLSTDGFIYAYVTETKVVEHEAENKFVASEATLNQHMGSSSLAADNGFVWTGAIPVDLTKESPFRVKVEGTKITEYTGIYQKIWLCADNTGTTKLSAAVLCVGQNSSNYAPLSSDGVIHADYKGGAKLSDSIITGTKYLRLGFKFSDSAIANTSALSGIKITFPSDAYSEEVEVSEWKNTGFTPETGGSGGGNYVTLLTKVEKNASDINEVSRRVTTLESGSDAITVPTFWENAVKACVAKIKALQVGRNCVTFPFFSDNHKNNRYAGALIAYVMKECSIPYCFFGGDAISNGADVTSEDVMIEQDGLFDKMMSVIPVERMCRTVGNHDAYWNPTPDSGASTRVYYSRGQIYDLFLRQESVAQNKHYGGDGTFYYVDDLASKTRFVLCNMNFNVNTSTETLDSEQINWLENEAMVFDESGWNLVFISHQPITNHYHSNIYAETANAIQTLLTNYVNGNSTNKAEIVGWFAGHIHADRIYTGAAANTTDDSVKNTLPWKTVTIRADNTGLCRDEELAHTVANDDQSHAIDFVTINKATRTVNLTRLGIGSDRSYTY